MYFFQASLLRKPTIFRCHRTHKLIQVHTGYLLGIQAELYNSQTFPWALSEISVEFRKIFRYQIAANSHPQTTRPEKGRTKVIGDRILKKERKREFEFSRSDRFRYRTRYFTDSGVIGSKEFVSKTYRRFKHHFNSINEKKPEPVQGLSGVYSLKRLSEVI